MTDLNASTATLVIQGFSENNGQKSLCDLFQTCPTWAYIYGAILDTGKVNWLTGRRALKADEETRSPIIDESEGRRFVGLPLTEKILNAKYADPFQAIGKRFSGQTDYFMLDVDRGSAYHPANNLENWRSLLGLMEDLGFSRPVIVTSSKSDGIHIYFPLSTVVKTWKLACFVTESLLSAGFVVKDGTIEVFPNKKSEPSAMYKAHRLPLQLGSYILHRNLLEPISDNPADFVEAWEWAAEANEFGASLQTPSVAPEPIAMTSGENPIMKAIALPRAKVQADVLPPFRFEYMGQTNEILGKLAAWASSKLNLRTIPELGQWIKETVCKLPGFQEFTSADSKADIALDWCFRWAKSNIRKAGIFMKKKTEKWADLISNDFKERLKVSVQNVSGRYFESQNQAIAAFTDESKRLFGKGFSKETLYQNKDLWIGLMDTKQPEVQYTELINAEPPYSLEQHELEASTQDEKESQITPKSDRITEVVEGRPLIEVLFEYSPEWIGKSHSILELDLDKIVI